MKKIFITTYCLLIFVFTVYVNAQEKLVQPSIEFQIKGDYPTQPLPQPEWIILEGATDLSIVDIKSGNFNGASIIDGGKITLQRSETDASFWFLVRLSSEISVENWKMVIDRQPPGVMYDVDQAIKQLTAYYFDHDQLISTRFTGREVPTSKRDLDDFYYQSVLVFDIAKNDTVDVWIHVEVPRGPITSSITIHNNNVELSNVPWPFKPTTFYYYMGFLTTLIIIGIFLLVWFKENVYIWFLLYLIMNVITIQIWNNQTFLIKLFAPEDPLFGQQLGFNLDIVKWTILLLFGRVFIDTKQFFPKLDKSLLILSWLFFLVGSVLITARVGPSMLNNQILILGTFLVILIPIIGILVYFILSKNNLARFYSIGAIIPFTGFFIIGLFREIIWVRNTAEVMMSVGPMITLTLAIVYRFRMEAQGRVEAEQERSRILENQTELLDQQVASRTDELQKSLENLKAAQSQLIQQEKLASLGQLTAGIAHEIKNPLNFVNNFSEVSVEMIEEAREEVNDINSKFEIRNSELLAILDDIKANLIKIHEHGSRADSVVKSMLQHSRGGSGVLESTDLNGLVREYVNLAFHGMRAGKNPIDVDIELNLDETVGQISLIAEDFSRVILNLCNNAFDAMREKTKQHTDYKPVLSVRTKVNDGQVSIEIEDNGPGIHDSIKDKILQPFFTTKKGTEGTGLGLSITHDIVKAHGGTMDVYSQSGQTVFTIKLNG
jgi:signal transduction histidine kinase